MQTTFDAPRSLPEKIAQLLCVRIGSNMPPVKTVEQDAQRVAAMLQTCPVGGLLLFNGQWPATRETLKQLQALAAVPLLIGSDIERGCGQQMQGLPLFPHAMAFGQAASREDVWESAVEKFGEITAKQARQCGIHIAFAPVADVNSNPKNPIIATRAFATNPNEAARHVAHYVRAAESCGLATAAKHFPGHGDTDQDSHDALPIVRRSRDSIVSLELPPFVSAIQSGCSLVMTSHVAYPSLDSSGTPATLSHAIVTKLLREELGFEGVVCSDSLLMAGVRERFDSEGALCLAALNVGVDFLLDVAEPTAVADYLVDAVATGELAEQRIIEACDRLMSLKRRLVAYQPRTASLGEDAGGAAELARQVARDAIQPFEGSSPVRLDATRPVTAILLKPFETALDPARQPLADALSEQFVDSRYFELGPTSDAEQIEQARQAALGSEQVLVAMIVKPAAWHKFGLLDYQQQLADELAAQPGTVLASLGVEAILSRFPSSASRVCTYSDVPVSQQALAAYLVADQ